jgi:predicted PurR-regulated permease PerM
MEALNPTVNKLQNIKIPRILATILVYLVIIIVFYFFIAGIIPIFIEQTSGLMQTLPATVQNIKIFGNSIIDFPSQFKIIESLPAEIAKTVLSIFSNLFAGFLTLLITFFLLQERQHFDNYIGKIFDLKGYEKAIKVLNLLENRLGKWVNGEFLLMIIVGVMSYIAYLILDLNYAVPLAIMAGILEIVPNIGPAITAIIVALVAFTVSPFTALLTVIAGLVIQQLENNFIVPKIMKKTVGLHPLVTILAIAIGTKLAGIFGAILGIPIFLTIQIIFEVLLDDH